VQLRIIKIEPQRHRLGLSLRQAEEGGEFGSGGGFEAWTGGTSYGLGGDASADGEEDGATIESNGSEPSAVEADGATADRKPSHRWLRSPRRKPMTARRRMTAWRRWPVPSPRTAWRG